MSKQKVAKVTISLPKNLLETADRLAQEWSTTRSGVVGQLLGKEEEAQVQALMTEGYQEMDEENRKEAEEALNVTGEVVLRNG